MGMPVLTFGRGKGGVDGWCDHVFYADETRVGFRTVVEETLPDIYACAEA